MEVTLTPEEAKLIWDALKYADPYNSPEAKGRHSEAMKIVASELRKVGVFGSIPY